MDARWTNAQLLIKGIRSFSPENTNIIQFPKPLTLIVGRNGAGKTTIIECLKMGSTGELPPSARSGQAFIHDPKVADATEVKAQIKLRFRNVTGKPFVVIRSFQLTQKARGKLEKKDLDSVIQSTNDKGETVSVSKKCVDINAEVPSLMGVSKAILENVVFVHQEESNWPLGDSAGLKKKFDEIFSATKYTKALEHIRKLKTEQTQLIRDYKGKVESLTIQKDHATKLRENFETARDKASDLTEHVASLEAKIQIAQEEIAQIEAVFSTVRQIYEKRNALIARREAVTSENARKLASMNTELTETLEELEKMGETFNQKFVSLKQERDVLDRKVNDARLEMEALKDHRERMIKTAGRLGAEAEAQTKRIEERLIFAQATAKEHPELGVESTSSINTDAFSEALTSRLSMRQDAIDKMRTKHRDLDTTCGAQIDEITERLSSHTQRIRIISEQQDACKLRREAINKELGENAVNESAVEDLEGRVKRANEAYATKKQSDFASQVKEEMERAEVNLRELEREMTKLRVEQETAAQAGESEMKIRMKKEELFSKTNALESILENCSDALRGVFGAAMPMNSELKDAIVEKLDELSEATTTAQDERNSISSNVAVLKHELAAAKATLENDRKELAAIKAKESSEENSFILGAGGFAGYNEAFEVVNREVADVEANMTQLKSLQTLFTKFLEEAERNQSCSLCKRGFASVEATDAFIQEMKTNMANAPSQIVALEQRVEKTRERRVLLQELGEVASQFKSLSEKVPETERTVSELEQKLKELREKQESIEKELASKQDVRSATAALVEDAGNISRMAKEVEALQASVNELESTSLGSNGATRSAVDIANDIEMLDVKREAADREKSILVKRKERHETELLTLERTARDLREELIVVKSRGDKRAQLKAELAEITEASASGAAEQKRMEEERAPGLAEKENLIRERETQRNTHAREQNDLDAEIRELQRVVDKITGMNAAIEQGKSLGTSERLAEHNKSLEETNTKIETLGTKLQSRSKQLTAKDEVIARQNDLKRELEDNIAFLRGKREEESILKEIEQLTSEMGNMGQVKDIESKLRQVTDRKNDLRAESAEAKGRVKAHEEAMKAANDQLKGAEYVNIEQRLTKQLVEKKTVEMVSEDLDRYHKALDKALMSFHSSKMEEINKVVRELWQRTYRGQDIDSIQIRSDSDGTTGKSSYNYRVVMLCGGAELEMRGRCSAGQKVLACLIIRLALAETFCLNCGILALDEPTTNLDAPNSDALARSLIEIMKSRRDQENFQLIVITHDMEFAHVLGQRELTEYYWRVTKDENQNSLIEKEDIYD